MAAAAFVFTRAVCAHPGCFEVAVSHCDCCPEQRPFCEDHGSYLGDERPAAQCFLCGGFNADE